MVGFACAIGVDMGFNAKHHHDEEEALEASTHVHADGKKHIHHEHQSNRIDHDKSHHHGGVSNQEESKEGSGNCCNDKVLKFEQLDKTIAQVNATVHPVFFTTFIVIYYNPDLILFSQRSVSTKYFVRSHHPPIPDIRIAIQSFQI